MTPNPSVTPPAGPEQAAVRPHQRTRTTREDYAVLIHGLHGTVQAAGASLALLGKRASYLQADDRHLLHAAEAWLDEVDRHILRATYRAVGVQPRRWPVRELLDILVANTAATTRRAEATRGPQPTIRWSHTERRASGSICVLVDAAALRLVLDELIENTARYRSSDRRGQIEIRALIQTEHLELRYSDDGPGIAEADRPHVFDDGYRGESARATAHQGIGAGLTEARRIIGEMSGTIRLEASDAGTCFLINLPLVDRSAP
jgi:signal transduction histidine kinase